MNEPRRVFLAEDEPLARRTLRELVADVPWLACAGEAGDGRTALEQIDALEPDLVFLDVQMPELNGLEVVAHLRAQPAIVFTTAYDDYAIAAFELGAIDYLLKPFGPERFSVTVERVRVRLDSATARTVHERFSDVRAEGPLQRIFARDGGTILPITIDEVLRFEAADDYVVVHLPDGRKPLIGLPLAELERRLDPDGFQRVHRGHIINMDRIRSMEPFDERRLRIELADGSHVVASRAGSQRLRKLLY